MVATKANTTLTGSSAPEITPAVIWWTSAATFSNLRSRITKPASPTISRPATKISPIPISRGPIREECVLCHSGNALHVSDTLNEYRSPIFPASEEAITCERCHGPAEKHLADPRAGNIVNPAKLEPAARDSICEQCHLFGVARVPNPGKQLSDFVPGERAEDVFTTYHDANPTGAFKVISHVEQLALSACARNSNGHLWCGTCHDPHNRT